ncbi:MAG: ABC transporter substrate-binding protein [Christensenellales bacterium]
MERKPDPVVLNFFLPMSLQRNEGDNVFLELIDAYNLAHDDVQIQVEGLPIKDGYNEVLEKRLSSGKGDDIFVVNADSVKGFVSRGYLYDLSELPTFDKLFVSAREQAVMDGVTYTIPLTMAVYGMYVNTDLLARYGLSAPTNYQEWIHCCQVLKENGITPCAISRWYGMTVPVMARGLYKLYRAENYDELVEGLNAGTIQIGDYMIEGFQLFEEFLDKGYYGEGLTGAYVDSIPGATTDLTDFQNQKVAFGFFNCSVQKRFDDATPFNYVGQGVPVMPDGVVTLPSIADRLCVNANSEHLEQALDAARYLTDDMDAMLLTEGSCFLPSRRGQKGMPPNAEHIENLIDLVEQDGQIPIEDMNLHFTYWDTVRILCLEMIDGMSAEEAAQAYNRIQLEQLQAYERDRQAAQR